MSINSIGGAAKANYSQGVVPKTETQPAFKIKNQKTDSFEGLSKNQKIAIGAGVAGAIALVGGTIYLAKSGKGKQALEAVKKFFSKNKNNTSKEAAEYLKDRNLVKLKDVKFDKGAATLNGEKYTGYIKDTLKNGNEVSLFYEKGVLKHSYVDKIKTTKNGQKFPQTLFAKDYYYNGNEHTVDHWIRNKAGGMDLHPYEFIRDESGKLTKAV